MVVAPDLINRLVVAIPAAPIPTITIFISSIFFSTTFNALSSAAKTTTAVPC